MPHSIRVTVKIDDGSAQTKIFTDPAEAASWAAQRWTEALPRNVRISWDRVPAATPPAKKQPSQQ